MPQWKSDKWALHLLQNEALLASQVEPRHKMSGCRLLVLRVFEQAWEDYVRYQPSQRKGRHGTTLFESAEQYFGSDDTFPYSFQWTCDLLGWEAGAVRKKLHEGIASSATRALRHMMNAGRGLGKITSR